MFTHLCQRTIGQSVSCSGLGVHSGKEVCLTILPAPVNHGIKFYRTDLPDQPGISAHFNKVVDTSLATVIGAGGAIVSTIEHLMAAFAGLSIDNARVELDAYEIPIMDGSAGPFTSMIRDAGFQKQEGPKCFFVIKKPIGVSENGKSVYAYPFPEFRITYTIVYDHPLVRKQTFSVTVTENTFEQEICSARTFGFLHEVEYLKRYGFARGGSLDNVVVLGARDVVNDDGLRFRDEFVRHKILDSIGDFSLLGMPMMGHLVIEKSGHAFNHLFLKEFFARKDAWETRTISEMDATDAFPPEAAAM